MAPFSESALHWGIPFGVALAALTGSLHCTFMCGPLIQATAPRPREWLLYLSGRLLSYSALGALAGQLHAELPITPAWQKGYSLVLSALLIAWGIGQWRGRGIQIPGLDGVGRLLRRTLPSQPFAVGFSSAFLPCGYLHGFLLGAFATGNAAQGALVMALFSLGSAPGLLSVPLFVRMARKFTKFEKRLRISPRKVSAGILIFSGLWNAILFGGWLHTPHAHHADPTPAHPHHSH